MIQNYLKTGMPVYGGGSTADSGQDQQHFRNECCKETFIQYTDEDHFPSFQFFIDFPIVTPVAPPATFRARLIRWDGAATTIGDFGAGEFPINVYHGIDGGYIVSHDYRDVVVYPAGFNNEDTYYIQIRLLDIRVGGGWVYWHTEIFKICDCEVDGAGDGIDLIEGGWFEDWSGAADPNNVPDGWTVVANNATNYVADAGGECQMISDNTQAIEINQTILTIGKWYVFTVDVTAVVAGGFYLRIEPVGLIAAFTAVGTYNVVFQATDTILKLVRTAACNITFTNIGVEEFIGFEFCDMITLNWWSRCDWDDIIYQTGYRNSLVLDTGLDTPKEEITGNAPSERLGDKKFSDIVIKKHYRLIERIPEYLWNALIRLPAYGSNMPDFHAWIVLPDGSAGEMKEVDVMGEWDTGNCMNTFTVEFIDDEYPVAATNCCDDEDVSEV